VKLLGVEDEKRQEARRERRCAGKVEDRVRGLEDGADDDLVKPSAVCELLERIGALSRRAPTNGATASLGARRVVRAEQRLGLTAKEFALLALLLQAWSNRPWEGGRREAAA
jgi:DNA-binding response OmpR family regulator